MTAGGEMKIIVAPDILPADAAAARQQTSVEHVQAGISPATVFVWRSERALVVTRQDAQLLSFDEASQTLRAEGWPVLVRTSGGGAFPVGPGTVQVALVAQVPSKGHSIDDGYLALATPLIEVLATFGVAADTGEGSHAFCRGRHDVLVAGRKVGGMAQHWRSAGNANFCTYAGASLIADEDPRDLADVVNRFYALAGGDFRCSSDAVTSLRRETGARPSNGLAAELLQRIAVAFQARFPLATEVRRAGPLPNSSLLAMSHGVGHGSHTDPAFRT